MSCSSPRTDSRNIIADIIAAGIPAIACGVPLGFEKKMGYVAADDYDGALDVLRYLRDGGRRRIATIAGPQDTSGGMRRLDRTATSRARGDERSVADRRLQPRKRRQAMTELLEREPDLDALLRPTT